jgi:hypothetical protein
MEKFTELMTSKFKHPLSPMFFFLGVLLVLLGVSNGLSLPILNQLASDANFRWACLALGILCLIASIFIFYHPPKEFEESTRKPSGAIGTIPEELTMTFSRRRAILSIKQGEILAYLIHKGYGGELITQDVIEKAFSQYGSGLLYRLEHLRLLGFLVRQKVGKDANGNERFAYALSPNYLKEIGDPKEFAQVSMTHQFNIDGDTIIGSQGPSVNESDSATLKKK